jgi:hypothetical protein
LKNRSENLAGRGQILTILQGNNRSIAQKSGEIWTGQANLQPISFKSDRLLGPLTRSNAGQKNARLESRAEYPPKEVDWRRQHEVPLRRLQRY